MTSYQYYNQIKNYISGKEEFSSVEDTQLKYSLNCLKTKHNKVVNQHNTSKEIPINTFVDAGTSSCDTEIEVILKTVKFCINDTGALVQNKDDCFATPTTKQFVMSVYDSKINKDQYALLLNESASFVTGGSANTELIGPAGSAILTKSMIDKIAQKMGLDLNDRTVLVHGATTAEVEEEIKKKATEGLLGEYAALEVCSEETEQQAKPNAAACPAAPWTWALDACRWYCPKASKTDIEAIQNCPKDENGKSMYLTIMASNDLDKASFTCQPNMDAAAEKCASMTGPSGEPRYAELVEIRDDKGKVTSSKVVCAVKKKSEAGCSICQIPRIQDDGSWKCVHPGGSPDINSAKAEISRYYTSSNAKPTGTEKDVVDIRNAGCLRDCHAAVVAAGSASAGNANIIWDDDQKLWKCIECTEANYNRATGKCEKQKCTGNLMYDDIVQRCVPIKWCRLDDTLRNQGVFIGGSDGVCHGKRHTAPVIDKVGSVNSTTETFSTLFRKVYNPIKKCFYCRISIPIPLSDSSPSGIIKTIMNKFESVANFISDIDFSLVSTAAAQTILDGNKIENKENTSLQDETEKNKYQISANVYPPYANPNNIIMLDMVDTSSAKETDSMYCLRDPNSLQFAINVNTGNSTINAQNYCDNCVAKGGDGSGVCVTQAQETLISTEPNLSIIVGTEKKDKNGYSYGLGDKNTGTMLTDMWNHTKGCFLVCNYKVNNCSVRPGFKRIYKNTSYPAEACNNYPSIANFPNSNIGGWSGAFRDLDVDQKYFNLTTEVVTFDNSPTPEEQYKTTIPNVVNTQGSTSGSINHCSIYVSEPGKNNFSNNEKKGTTALTKYLYNSDTGKSLCWPRLAMTDPTTFKSGHYSGYKGDATGAHQDNATIKACETDNNFGINTCIGQIIQRDSSGNATPNLSGIQTNGGQPATYTTKLFDIMFKNQINCNYDDGYCKITSDKPPACNGNPNTVYYKIIQLLSDGGWISSAQTNGAIAEYNNKTTTGAQTKANEFCPAGYRQSVTWIFKDVKFKDGSSDVINVMESNCMFCEKVLFAPADLTNPMRQEQKVFDRTSSPGGTDNLPDYNKADENPNATNDAIANYYLGTWNPTLTTSAFVGPKTMGSPLGGATIPVFRVNPNLGYSDYENLVKQGGKGLASDGDNKVENYIDPFASTGSSLSIKNATDGSLVNGSKKAVHFTTNVISQIKNGQLDLLGGDEASTSSLNSNRNATRIGVCPGGMIEVASADGKSLTCQSWITKPHRNECVSGWSQQSYYNSILSGNGGINTGKNETSDKTYSKGRPGCIIGYDDLDGNDGNLTCTINNNAKTCRSGYVLQAIFKDGKLSFECRETIGGDASCMDSISGAVTNIAVNRCGTGSIGPIENIVTYPTASTNLNNDNASEQCPMHKITGAKDEFGRTIPIIYRATSMYLIGDCNACF